MPLKWIVFGVAAIALFVVANQSSAAVCSIGTPTTPEVQGNGDVESFGDAGCTSSVQANYWTRVVRVRTAWPDAVVSTTTDEGTKSYFSGTASGCEPAAAGSSHRYAGRNAFFYSSGSLYNGSDVVWRTCT